MKRTKILLPVFTFIAFVFLSACMDSQARAAESSKTINKGVYIDTVDIGGMTAAEAREAVKSFVSNLQDKQIAIVAGDGVVYTSMRELGYRCEPHTYIEQALGLVSPGNLIKRYKNAKDIEHGKVVYPLTFTYDEEKLRKLVETKVTRYNIKPENASFSRQKGEFVYIDHKLGSKVNVDQTVALIKSNIENWNRLDILVQAVMEDDMPEFTREMLESCNTVLGEFKTEFKDSAEGRAANLANGARLINNAVLFPGEEFSSLDYLLPFKEYNGYYVANSYLNGEIVESVGGGACQVTTTLYNAVLLSELNIVYRSNHSMTVSYVPLSMDAAVSEYGLDFRFSNNKDYPVLIEAFSKDKTITFRIWGHETRDTARRKLEFVSKTIDVINPPSKDIITEDPTKPTTYRKVTQQARKGYKAELYKVVYVDGKETERTLVNRSSYAAKPNHVTIGTMKATTKKTGQ